MLTLRTFQVTKKIRVQRLILNHLPFFGYLLNLIPKFLQLITGERISKLQVIKIRRNKYRIRIMGTAWCYLT